MSRHSSILVGALLVSAALASPAILGAAASAPAARDGAGDAIVIAQTAAPEKPAEAQAPAPKSSLLDPKGQAVNQKAPEVFKVKFETSKGDFVMEVHREWAPNGADRFYNLVNAGFYDSCRFFRVIKGFMAQVGLNGDPKVSAAWKNAKIADDPVKGSNKRGYVSYAMAGPNTRTTQLFISYKDNSRLDGMGFSPFAQVTAGMEIVDALYSEYGENPPEVQGAIQSQGNAYLQQNFPKLDYIKTAKVVK